jgi:acyl dehydratase
MTALHSTVAELGRAGPRELGSGEWMTIEQSRVNLFADATDDHQWIHVDTERAVSGPFGTTIAHGYLTLSLLPRMLDELLVVTDQVRGTNYGIDRLRFTDPVPVGSRIRLEARIAEARQRDDGGVQYKIAFRVQVQGRDRPAVVGESIYLAYSDPGS